jgi:hypothetical protein
VNPSWDKLEKEVVIPKEFKTSKKEDVAVGLQGRTTCKYGNLGFFIRLRWLIGFFLPLTAGFSLYKLQVFPLNSRANKILIAVARGWHNNKVYKY